MNSLSSHWILTLHPISMVLENNWNTENATWAYGEVSGLGWQGGVAIVTAKFKRKRPLSLIINLKEIFRRGLYWKGFCVGELKVHLCPHLWSCLSSQWGEKEQQSIQPVGEVILWQWCVLSPGLCVRVTHNACVTPPTPLSAALPMRV